MEHHISKPAAANPDASEWLELVRQQVVALRFGVVQITVHDSRVVQIETTERLRFEGSKPNQR